MSESLWPTDYNLPFDIEQNDEFCGDVMKGCYDVPFNPAKPPVILDLGACVGAFARYAYQRWPGATIHCYEPSPRNFVLLQRTTMEMLGGDSRIELHNVAVLNKEGKSILTYSPFNNGGDSLVFQYDKEGVERHEVPTISAATLPRADMLKMDMEGCESIVLRELVKCDRLKEFSAVMMETHANTEMHMIAANMLRYGFVLTKFNQWAFHRSVMCFVKKELLPSDFVPIAPPKKSLVWIATPLRYLANPGKITSEMFEALPPHYRDPIKKITFTDTLPWTFDLALVGGGGVARARNQIVAEFYKSKADYLFFVDYDLMPTAEDYVRILTSMDNNMLLVCGGLYPTRSNTNCHWVINFPSDMGPDPKTGLLQVLELGTGFKCYKREAFDTIAKKNPWLKYVEDDSKEEQWGFFSMGPVKDDMYWPGKSRWLSEDYWLDWLTRDAGISIGVDTNVKLNHYDEDTEEIFPDKFPDVPQATPPEVRARQLAEADEIRKKLVDTAQVGIHTPT